MACGCQKKAGAKGFVWTSSDGRTKKETRSEIEARALTIRQGGSYQPKK
jgi:hypothetical protein